MSKVVTPCKGRSRKTSSYFCPYRALPFLLLITQGVALGYGLHWAFSPHLLNPKLEYIKVKSQKSVAPSPVAEIEVVEETYSVCNRQ